MNSFVITLISIGSIFAGALFGIGLQRRLPSHHLSGELHDLVKLCAGMIATLTALVLGLLVSSAKSSFDAINAGIVQGSAKFVLMDRTLARYGPEAKPAREQLKRVLAGGIQMIWPTEKTGVPVLTAFERANGMELVQNKLGELSPKNDAQRQFLAQAQQIANDLGQTRWLLIEESHNKLPAPLLLILVFWLVLLFTSFGLFSPCNSTALTVLFVGACAISASVFLVLELNHPLDGVIKASSEPFQNALGHLSQ